MKIKLITDVYDISNRIKEIDKDYYIVYNTQKGKFELHNSSQGNTTYCLTIPYSELDERTLKYAMQTKSENIEKILQNIDNENKLKESADKTTALNSVYDAMLDMENT